MFATDINAINNTNQKIYCATSPSNIAFIKYWGKKDRRLQIPANSSLSMTLARASTTTKVQIQNDEKSQSDQFTLKGSLISKSSYEKPQKFLHWLREELKSELPKEQLQFLNIDSENNFPAESGIASSASGLSALTLAAVAAWTKANSLAELAEKGFPRERLAKLSKMGSGSSGRSFFAGYGKWEIQHPNNREQFSQRFKAEHWKLFDFILMTDLQAKKVSSSKGHELAATSPLFDIRLAGVENRLLRLEEAIEAKNFQNFGPLIEEEALEMHAIMMTSSPAVYYLHAKTCQLLTKIRQLRSKGDLNAFFTLDAGHTVHLICEEKDYSSTFDIVSQLSQGELVDSFLIDYTGLGPMLSAE